MAGFRCDGLLDGWLADCRPGDYICFASQIRRQSAKYEIHKRKFPDVDDVTGHVPRPP